DVRDVADGERSSRDRVAEFPGVRHCRPRDVRGEHCEECREEAERATGIEAPKRCVAALTALEQEAGDQKAREDEKEIHAERALGRLTEGVEADDGENCDAANAVE